MRYIHISDEDVRKAMHKEQDVRSGHIGIPLKRPTKPRSRVLSKPNRISHLWSWRRDLNPRPSDYKSKQGATRFTLLHRLGPVGHRERARSALNVGVLAQDTGQDSGVRFRSFRVSGACWLAVKNPSFVHTRYKLLPRCAAPALPVTPQGCRGGEAPRRPATAACDGTAPPTTHRARLPSLEATQKGRQFS